MTTSVNSSVGADFGPNEWLVHEIWQQYREDPESVSPEWREFLSDHPSDERRIRNMHDLVPVVLAAKKQYQRQRDMRSGR